MESNAVGATARICRDLGLPPGDAYTQDWVYELPEEFRTKDFLGKYVLAYSAHEYGPAEKQVLMQLVLDVANDLLERNEVLEASIWEKVEALLELDRQLHRELIEKWALLGEPLEDAFSLTPKMRVVRERLAGQ